MTMRIESDNVGNSNDVVVSPVSALSCEVTSSPISSNFRPVVTASVVVTNASFVALESSTVAADSDNVGISIATAGPSVISRCTGCVSLIKFGNALRSNSGESLGVSVSVTSGASNTPACVGWLFST